MTITPTHIASRTLPANRLSQGRASAAPAQLTPEQQQQVQKLKQRDQEVRQHEQAHMAAGGDLAGGVSYSYTRGPDGRSYATGGEVPIDASPVSGDPEATIRKAQRVRAAALAPANPSGQDRAVAARATQMEAQARTEAADQVRDAPSQAWSVQATPDALGASLDIRA